VTLTITNCHYAECRILFIRMLDVIMLSVAMLSVVIRCCDINSKWQLVETAFEQSGIWPNAHVKRHLAKRMIMCI
jgi:hypothetical protein